MRRERSRAHPGRGARIGREPLAAIIVAGGRGERADDGSGSLKQFRELNGRPVVAWSADLFLQLPAARVIVVVPTGYEEATAALFPPEVVVTPGGVTRQDSVAAGLALVEEPITAVHDGARPFATPALLERVLRALEGADAVVPALPVLDTLKRIEGERVVETVDRSHLWRAQTPQVFQTAVLRDAHGRAAADAYVATDDAELIERYGGEVRLVEGDYDNMKMTTAHDFVVARALRQVSG